eukprot:scaffold17007_cov64-Cyclotella_meneghiniana.AAC.2
MQDVVVGVPFRLRWMTQTDIVDEIYDGREISTMFVIMAALESITAMAKLLMNNECTSLLAGGVTVQGAIHCVETIDEHCMIDGES